MSGGTTTLTTYIGGGIEEAQSVNGGATTLTKYLGAPGMPTAIRVGTGGTLSYLASDGLSSVSEALDSSGIVTAQQLYAPYGGSRYSNGTLPTSKGFTGQRADSASSGLDYYGARYYDPLLGQFASADTVADGLNRYGYVHGNPTTFTDPSGHYACYVCDGSDRPTGTPQSKPKPKPAPPAPPSGDGGTVHGGVDPTCVDKGTCVGTNAGTCKGKQHCVILGTGPNIGVHIGDDGSLDKNRGGFDAVYGNFYAWMQAILTKFSKFGETVGFILFEADDATLGAETLHGFLGALSDFTGTISVVAHSNAAAALFTYMSAASADGAFSGDAVINNFVALDAPASTNPLVLTGEIGWSHWDPWSTSSGASAYVSQHGTRGVYAYSILDVLSGPVLGRWDQDPELVGTPWDAHLQMLLPTEKLLGYIN